MALAFRGQRFEETRVQEFRDTWIPLLGYLQGTGCWSNGVSILAHHRMWVPTGCTKPLAHLPQEAGYSPEALGVMAVPKGWVRIQLYLTGSLSYQLCGSALRALCLGNCPGLVRAVWTSGWGSLWACSQKKSKA